MICDDEKAQAVLMGARCTQCYCVDGIHYADCLEFIKQVTHASEIIWQEYHKDIDIVGYWCGEYILSPRVRMRDFGGVYDNQD